MLFEVILDEVEFEYIVNLIQRDIQRNNDDSINRVKETILENLRYYYKHRKIDN